jgi:hypothetical protein
MPGGTPAVQRSRDDCAGEKARAKGASIALARLFKQDKIVSGFAVKPDIKPPVGKVRV